MFLIVSGIFNFPYASTFVYFKFEPLENRCKFDNYPLI